MDCMDLKDICYYVRFLNICSLVGKFLLVDFVVYIIRLDEVWIDRGWLNVFFMYIWKYWLYI